MDEEQLEVARVVRSEIVRQVVWQYEALFDEFVRLVGAQQKA
jgi:hypothetical protein